jgi:hypothetical protein
MAVINAFQDANVAAGKKGNPAIVSGGKLLCIAGTFEFAAADDNGSIYKLAKLPANAIPVKFDLINDATAGATDIDAGLYKENGVVADKDLLLDGGDLSAGHAITAPLDGLTNLGGADPIAAVGKKLWELLGLTVDTKETAYDLALTANAAASAAGTVSYRLWYILG